MVNKELKIINIMLKNLEISGLFISYVGTTCIDLIVPFDEIIRVADIALQRGHNLKITGYGSPLSYFCKICK